MHIQSRWFLAYICNRTDSAAVQVLFPNLASKTSVEHFVKQDERGMRDFESTKRYVCVKDGEKVVSFAMWKFFVGRGKDGDGKGEQRGEVKTEEQPRKEDEGKGEEKGGGDNGDDWPSDVNQDAIKVLFAQGIEKREKIMRGRGDYTCKCIVLLQLEICFEVPLCCSHKVC